MVDPFGSPRPIRDPRQGGGHPAHNGNNFRDPLLQHEVAIAWRVNPCHLSHVRIAIAHVGSRFSPPPAYEIERIGGSIVGFAMVSKSAKAEPDGKFRRRVFMVDGEMSPGWPARATGPKYHPASISPGLHGEAIE